MNAQRLVRQLKKEIKTNPKRAALLACLCGVGVYFWAPLVAGWVIPKDKQVVAAPAKKSGSAASAKTPGSPSQSANAGSTAGVATTPWTELWATIQSDNRTKPAVGLAATIDPFRPFPVPAEFADNDEAGKGTDKTTKQTDAAKAIAAKPADATPKSLGMKLTGTIVGSGRRAAVIDGKVVPEGAMVIGGGAAPTSTTASGGSSKYNTKAPPAKAVRIAFKLVRVEAQSVILERDKKPFTLTIEQPERSGIEFAPMTRPSS
jgi:hypothetical protein